MSVVPHISGLHRPTASFTDTSALRDLGVALHDTEVELERVRSEYQAALADLQQKFARETAVRKSLEARLNEQQVELAHAQRLQMLGEMTASIAHEISQPISAINNYAATCLELLKSHRANPSTAEFALTQVVDLTHRTGEMVRRLRTMAKKRDMDCSLSDLVHLAHEAAIFIEQDLRAVGVRVRFDCEQQQDCSALVDGIQIQQVLINLIRNAAETLVQLPAAEREVTVSVHPLDDEWIEMAVINRGPPIAAEVLETLFVPFHSTKPDGLGMGLAICKRIVEAHGGTIAAVSSPHSGTRFCCRLPIRRR